MPQPGSGATHLELFDLALHRAHALAARIEAFRSLARRFAVGADRQALEKLRGGLLGLRGRRAARAGRHRGWETASKKHPTPSCGPNIHPRAEQQQTERQTSSGQPWPRTGRKLALLGEVVEHGGSSRPAEAVELAAPLSAPPSASAASGMDRRLSWRDTVFTTSSSSSSASSASAATSTSGSSGEAGRACAVPAASAAAPPPGAAGSPGD